MFFRRIAARALEYLISLGHRKIGYVGDCHNESRYKGYQETLFHHNIEMDIQYVIETDIPTVSPYPISKAISKPTITA